MTVGTQMTREQMREKLSTLTVGVKVRWRGKTYTVVFAEECGGKLARRDMYWLEDIYSERWTQIPIKYGHAAGTMTDRDNAVYRKLSAQKSHIDFEVIA